MKRKRIAEYVNRKNWWHVPAVDPTAHSKRGTFYASTFSDAEFYGRPLDEPTRVRIENPLVGDEETIERTLFGKRVSWDDMSVQTRFKLDSKIRKAAILKGHDSVLLMAPIGFRMYLKKGKIPRSLELNVFGKIGTGS